MAAEYSYPLSQTVAADENIIFLNGSRCCKKGNILHRDSSGQFTLRGSTCQYKATYNISFTGNIAIAEGGTVEPISVALAVNGETLNNARAVATPTAVGDFWNVTISTLVDVPCNCCLTVAVENTSETTPIDVTNANITFYRIA